MSIFLQKILAALLISGLFSACKSKVITSSSDTPRPVKIFDLADVKLLDGPFKHATELNKKSLLKYDPDRLLARFRIEAGLDPKAEPYGGWEAESLAGHSLGHHLSACALMFQTTGDKIFRERANYIVSELAEVQQANGGQYIGAFSDGKKIFEEQIAKGNIRSQGFDLNGIWAPFYTHHKVMAGLRDAFRVFENEQSLMVEKNFADWIGTIILGLTNEQRQEMMQCEFGGVQETLADLYADTGEEVYLEIARAFHHEAIIDPLTEGNDILPGKHGNTQIPKLIASSRLYEITGEENYQKSARFFWNTVVDHHSYVTGGHGNHEYFGQPDQLRNRLSDGTTETCNVYNMLKLSAHLFAWEPSIKVADYYERALFNHILSTQHPETGQVIYNLSLEMGGHKHYQNPEWFTCCVGTGMETHSKYGSHIYFHNDEELYINQYIASTLDWKEKGMVLTQSTQFPKEESSQFSFSLEQPVQITLFVRYPSWAERGIEISINGEDQRIENKKGSFLAINRLWKDGDRVEVRFPFSIRLETMPDDPGRIAIFNGPVLMAGDFAPYTHGSVMNAEEIPVLLSESRIPEDWLTPVEGKVNSFKTVGVGHPNEIAFRPFYEVHDRVYSIYFDLFTEEEWEAHKAAYKQEKERKMKVEEMTYDAFQPGEMQPERDHNFKGEKLNIRESFKNRKARGAERGGWLSFDMKVKKGSPMALVIEYWGGFTGSKTFDILVDEVKIATENISGKKDGAFIDVEYGLPEVLTKGKDKITVKFSPHVGHRAGPFFYARTVLLNASNVNVP